MRAVKLQFSDPNHLLVLLNNPEFFAELWYLRPCRLDDNTLTLFDPVDEHTLLDTEIVILTKFGKAIKNVLFENMRHTVKFINPILGERKIGLVFDKVRIVTITEIED